MVIDFIRIKYSGGFKMHLDWWVVDGSLNKVTKITEAEQKIYDKIQIQEFFGKSSEESTRDI